MRDPVTGFIYPKRWEERVRDPHDLIPVAEGFAVLTASGTILRRGFTTGTTAAAACKAAILSLSGEVSRVSITLPCGIVAEVPATGRSGHASSMKYAGDYPGDVTAGLEFVAEAKVADGGISLIPGEGIGHFIRDTPRYRKKDPAISEAPLACILGSMEEALDLTGLPGVLVCLSVPAGESVAKKTLNSKVGIVGGISILGSTGLVEPWDDHLEESVLARVAGADNVVITTGRVGLRYARMLFPDREIILAGGKIREALSVAHGDVTLCGLPALILKYIEPHILDHTGCNTVEELASRPEFLPVVRPVLDRYTLGHPEIRIVILDRNGKVVVESS